MTAGLVFWILLAALLGLWGHGRRGRNLGGFSWRRLIGISGLKYRIGRSIGVPLTRSGRERKIGRLFWRW